MFSGQGSQKTTVFSNVFSKRKSQNHRVFRCFQPKESAKPEPAERRQGDSSMGPLFLQITARYMEEGGKPCGAERGPIW